MKEENKTLSFGDRCFIIAEAGVNHNGDINLAKKLIDAAAEAGADAIKFQSFKTESLVSAGTQKAEYQKTGGIEEGQKEMLKALEISPEEHKILLKYCEEKNILFLSTPFDFESADLLEQLGIPFYKISSGDLTNLPFLKYIAKFKKTMVISTGMADLGEIEEAIEAVKTVGKNQIVLLHCNSTYPTPYEEVNLRAMHTLKEAFQLPVGFSDHTTGIEIPIAAVALGAVILEKHFTIDKGLEGPDQKFSLNPIELKSMVEGIRKVEKALGNGVKRCSEEERKNKNVSRKSIVSKKHISIGEALTLGMLTLKRPGDGIPPKYMESIVGKAAVKEIEEDSVIKWDSIQ